MGQLQEWPKQHELQQRTASQMAEIPEVQARTSAKRPSFVPDNRTPPNKLFRMNLNKIKKTIIATRGGMQQQHNPDRRASVLNGEEGRADSECLRTNERTRTGFSGKGDRRQQEIQALLRKSLVEN